MMKADLPILYTFRRCPYAMRARMALIAAQIPYETREILLKDKPQKMLEASPKGTVPILILHDGRVIDESYDIMKWALTQNDPLAWLGSDEAESKKIDELIQQNDFEFKPKLDDYKYSIKHKDVSIEELRGRAVPYLKLLNKLLKDNKFLASQRCTLADIAIFVFIRQFKNVDESWFKSLGLTALYNWLEKLLASDLFEKTMVKNPVWSENS